MYDTYNYLKNKYKISIAIYALLVLMLLMAIAYHVTRPKVAEGAMECAQATSTSQIMEKPLTVEEKIEIKAKEYGLRPNTMLAIAKAESRYRNVPNFKYTGESGYYTAAGIFQITKTTYRSYCGSDISERWDVDKNIDCAMRIASSSGLHHWSESASNW